MPPFFCSNALIALARSLCKCLLAVLITASEADAVTGFLVRGASQYDTIPRREKKNTATKPTQASNKTTQKQNKAKQRHHKNQNITIRPKATMKRNDQATYVPGPEQVILETTAQSQTLKDDREVPSKKVAVPKPRIPPARIPEIASRSRAGITSTNAHRSPRYAELCEKI